MSLFHKKGGPIPLTPCKHMEGLLNKAADGSARGLARWYAFAHAAKCERCKHFLNALMRIIGGLRASRQSQTDEKALDRITERFRVELSEA